MQILFRTRHPEAALMLDAVERRVRFAFRRLNALVPRAEVKLEDINGPRGGPDKRCQIALRTDGAGAWSCLLWPRTGAARWTKPWQAPPATFCVPGDAAQRSANSSAATGGQALNPTAPANTLHRGPSAAAQPANRCTESVPLASDGTVTRINCHLG